MARVWFPLFDDAVKAHIAPGRCFRYRSKRIGDCKTEVEAWDSQIRFAPILWRHDTRAGDIDPSRSFVDLNSAHVYPAYSESPLSVRSVHRLTALNFRRHRC